jgi:hypothetical protein
VVRRILNDRSYTKTPIGALTVSDTVLITVSKLHRI